MDATSETPLDSTMAIGTGETSLRWAARATSVADIERELARIWAVPRLVTVVAGVEERHVAARTSVMNLVVIARRPETGERCATTISALTGRHPSRTLIISSRDPDGPNWLDARIDAHCVLPREDAPEVCAEMIHLSAGGATGRHLDAIVAPLLVHDLPVTIWWPNEPTFGTPQATDLLAMADRLIVDGSSWGGTGLRRLGEMAGLLGAPLDAGVAGAGGSGAGGSGAGGPTLAITDFALSRQSRWREAIASVFDAPEILPYLRYVHRIRVTYASHDSSGRADLTNVVKPVYHVAWFGSRLGMAVRAPLDRRRRADLEATLSGSHGMVAVTIRPVHSTMPSGTTLSVELNADRLGSTLDAVVTAEAETVNVSCRRDGAELPTRSFLAPRRTDVNLLAEAIEAGHRDPVAAGTIRFAAALAGDTP
jgi:glucose-6-phosphate dehydrogenase assembly protein OpcA